MNIKYHAACGILLDCTITKFPIGLISSIIPDVPLIKNEIKLILNKEKFDENKISQSTFIFYKITHSFLFGLCIIFLSKTFAIGYNVHLLLDCFSHIGKFTAVPFYPLINWRFKWGRNILK